MGIVYEAWDRHRERLVALKTLRRMQPKDLLRFKNEYRLLRDLHHPNLIELGELVEHEGNWFFSMELIDGVNIVRYTGKSQEQRRLDAERAASEPDPFAKRPARCREERLRPCIRQLAEGLLALHATNTVHRDIKPSNVIVTPEGRLVLLDLGLAIVSGRDDMESKMNVAAGTSEYMAPEQAAAKPVGPEADWYSVGVVLFQAMTGRVPFTGPHLEISVRKLQEDPPRPSDVSSGIPPDLDDLCFRLLSREAGDRPSGDEVVAAVGRADGVAQVRTQAHGTTFVGRTAELELLDDALERSLSGRVVAVALRGESGVGKSALLHEFTGRTREVLPSVLVVSGRCYQREAVPYNALDEVVDMLVRSLTRATDEELGPLLTDDLSLAANVFPVLRRLRPVARRRPPTTDGIESRELRSRVFESIRQLIGRVAQTRPVVVAIEDVQWADDESRALLDYLFRPPAFGACLLLTTERADMDAVMGWRAPDVDVIELQPLPQSDAEQVVTRLLPWSSRAAEIARASGGHPLLLRELMRHIGRDSELPDSVRPEELLWARIETLDESSRRVLRLLALAGAPMPQEVAAFAADMSFPELADVVESLRRENLVRTSGVRRSDVADVYHDRIRTSILSHLEGDELAALHESLALALEAAGGTDDEALARHWHVAGAPLKARDYAVRAGQAAADAFAYDRAARLFQMALDLANDKTPEASQRRVRSKLADVYASSGRALEAARGYLAAADGSGDVASLELRRRAAEQLLSSGHIEEGMPVLEGVLEGVGMSMPRSPRRAILSMVALRALRTLRGIRYDVHPAGEVSIQALRRIDVSWSTVLGIGAVDHRYAPLFQIRHLNQALRAGEPYRLVRALSLECMMMGAAGVTKQAYVSELFGHIERLLAHTDRPHAEGFATVARGVVYSMWGRWREAREILVQGESLLRDRCSGVSREVALSRQFLFATLTFLGEFDELERVMLPAIVDAEERGDLYAATAYRLGAQSQLWLAQDDVDGARTHVEEALRPWPGPAFLVQHYQGLVANAQIDLYSGDAERAWARFAESWQGLRSGHILRMQFARIIIGYLRGRAAVALAARAEGQRNRREYLKAARSDARRLESESVSYSVLFAQILRAGVASVEDKLDTAEALLDQAASLAGEIGFASHCAAAEWCLGGLRQGGEAAELREVAERTLRDQRVADPEKLVRLLIPGFE